MDYLMNEYEEQQVDSENDVDLKSKECIEILIKFEKILGLC